MIEKGRQRERKDRWTRFAITQQKSYVQGEWIMLKNRNDVFCF